MVLAALVVAVLPGYTTMPVSEFAEKLHAGFFGVLIDTRDTSEWNAGHLPNATFMRNLHINHDTTAITGCQACNIGIYCHSGYRSKQAATALETIGFTSVYDVQGIVQWQGAGHSLVSTPSHVAACSLGGSICAWPHLSPSSPPPPSYPWNWPQSPPQTSPRPPPSPPPPPPMTPPEMPLGTKLGLAGGGATLLLLACCALVCRHWRKRRARGNAGDRTKDMGPMALSTMPSA